jgi:hypothetical protein
VPTSPFPTLIIALSVWAVAAFFVITGFGAFIGLPLGLFALWPFGVFLHQCLHPSKIMLVVVLVAVGLLFLAASLAFLMWLPSTGYS